MATAIIVAATVDAATRSDTVNVAKSTTESAIDADSTKETGRNGY
jgi:hypothetical protein